MVTKKLWPFPLPIMACSTVFKSSRIQIEIVLVELVTLFWKCMEEVTKVIFDAWNRSQIVFGSVELVTSINVISGHHHNFFFESVELVTLINVASGHDHNFFGSVELITFILVTSGQLFNCYNLIHHWWKWSQIYLSSHQSTVYRSVFLKVVWHLFG